MNTLDSIEALSKVINDDDVTLHYHKKLDKMYGYINFQKQEIHVAYNKDDEQILVTMIHEFGHWIAYKRSVRDYGYYSHQNVHAPKEIDAYRYGWWIITKLGLGMNKKSWKKHHKNEIRNYVFLYGKTACWMPRIMREPILTSSELRYTMIVIFGFSASFIWLAVGVLSRFFGV